MYFHSVAITPPFFFLTTFQSCFNKPAARVERLSAANVSDSPVPAGIRRGEKWLTSVFAFVAANWQGDKLHVAQGEGGGGGELNKQANRLMLQQRRRGRKDAGAENKQNHGGLGAPGRG